MKIMTALIQESNYAHLMQEIHDTLEEFEGALRTYRDSLLTEAEDVTKTFDEAMAMLDAAKRGLGITNKLKDPGQRAMHRSRVMGNMNRIRAMLRKIERQIEAQES